MSERPTTNLGEALYVSDAMLESSILLEPKQDIEPLPWERMKPSMHISNWETGFRGLDIPALVFEGCRFSVGMYRYANRGDHTDMQPSRSQAVVSNWSVQDQDFLRTALGITDVRTHARLKVFFPVYDGIGFWIGKRRRETGVVAYTRDQELAIARVSAIGALSIGTAAALPIDDEIVHRCVWAPGKMYDAEGSLIPSVATSAFIEAGLEPKEVIKVKGAGEQLSFRLYGDTRSMSPGSHVVRTRFSSAVAELLHPAWKHVNLLPNTPDPPPEETY